MRGGTRGWMWWGVRVFVRDDARRSCAHLLHETVEEVSAASSAGVETVGEEVGHLAELVQEDLAVAVHLAHAPLARVARLGRGRGDARRRTSARREGRAIGAANARDAIDATQGPPRRRGRDRTGRRGRAGVHREVGATRPVWVTHGRARQANACVVSKFCHFRRDHRDGPDEVLARNSRRASLGEDVHGERHWHLAREPAPSDARRRAPRTHLAE